MIKKSKKEEKPKKKRQGIKQLAKKLSKADLKEVMGGCGHCSCDYTHQIQ